MAINHVRSDQRYPFHHFMIVGGLCDRCEFSMRITYVESGPPLLRPQCGSPEAPLA